MSQTKAGGRSSMAADAGKKRGGARKGAGRKPGQDGYKPEFAAQALKFYEKGFTDEEVAEFFAISARTLYRWQVSYPEFCQSIKMGKAAPDDRTERSLYHRANGYEWIEEQAIKVKEVRFSKGRRVSEIERVELVSIRRKMPPDTTAAIFWLKNRRPEEWRDRKELTGADGAPLVPVLNVIYGDGRSGGQSDPASETG